MPWPQIRGYLIGLVVVVLKAAYCGNVRHTHTHTNTLICVFNSAMALDSRAQMRLS